MWTIVVGPVDNDTEEAEVLVANNQNAWGIVLPESDPLYTRLIAAADAVVQRWEGQQ